MSDSLRDQRADEHHLLTYGNTAAGSAIGLMYTATVQCPGINVSCVIMHSWRASAASGSTSTWQSATCTQPLCNALVST